MLILCLKIMSKISHNCLGLRTPKTHFSYFIFTPMGKLSLVSRELWNMRCTQKCFPCIKCDRNVLVFFTGSQQHKGASFKRRQPPQKILMCIFLLRKALNVFPCFWTISSSIQISYLLTPWSRVLPEKLTGPQLIRKFPEFYGNRGFITTFRRTRHVSLSSARLIQSMPPPPCQPLEDPL